MSPARKALKVCYEADGRVDALLYAFRDMVNWAIDYAVRHRVTGRFRLRDALYRQFRERYGCHSHYPYSACEAALAMIRNRKRRKIPAARRLMLKLDNQSYRLEGDGLSIPVRLGERITLKLSLSPYHRKLLRQAKHMGSVTVTPDHVILAIDKPVQSYKPWPSTRTSAAWTGSGLMVLG